LEPINTSPLNDADLFIVSHIIDDDKIEYNSNSVSASQIKDYVIDNMINTKVVTLSSNTNSTNTTPNCKSVIDYIKSQNFIAGGEQFADPESVA
jgi:hypothetical protein